MDFMIACEISSHLNDAICRSAIHSYAICAWGDLGDVAISGSHKYMDLTPEDGSLVIFFSSES